MNQTNAQQKVVAFFTYVNAGYNADGTRKEVHKHLFNTQYNADPKVVAPDFKVAANIMAFNGFVQKVIRWTGDPISFGIFKNFYTQALDQSVHRSPLQDAMEQLSALSITE